MGKLSLVSWGKSLGSRGRSLASGDGFSAARGIPPEAGDLSRAADFSPPTTRDRPLGAVIGRRGFVDDASEESRTRFGPRRKYITSNNIEPHQLQFVPIAHTLRANSNPSLVFHHA